MSTEMDEQVDGLDEEIKDLKSQLDAYHVERQELRSVLLPADCDWEHHPSLVQCAKDLKAKLEACEQTLKATEEAYHNSTPRSPSDHSGMV